MTLYFIEHLTFITWCFYVVPLLLKKYFIKKNNKPVCYYWDSSKMGFLIARMTAKIIGVSVKEFKYRIQNVHDENGLSTFLNVLYNESARIQADISHDSLFIDYLKKETATDHYLIYLKKSLITYDFMNTGIYDHIINSLLLIHITFWKAAENGHKNDIFLFIRKRKWFWVIQKDALRYGVQLMALPAKIRIDYRRIIRKIIPMKIINSLLYMLENRSIPKTDKSISVSSSTDPKIATEYYGHLNLDQQECYSDLFFFQQSGLKGEDILLMFNLPSDPLDIDKYKELKQNGIVPIALSSRATKISFSSIYNPHVMATVNRNGLFVKNIENKWMANRRADYNYWRSYWIELFERFNIKIYTSWFKYDSSHIAVSDAMESLGGITAIYQRSFESLPNPTTTIYVDIEFGFSTTMAKVEKQNGSNILYHVTTGYPGDHRFAMLRVQGKAVRDYLIQNGANYILAYFDENTIDDPRWYLDHVFAQNNYAFFLEKVLEDKGFGLILKPKNPRTLLHRLGPVARLLEEAVGTGRCYIYSDGSVQGSYPPAAAAVAADIAVHDGISAATAGLESALCGVPTVLMDHEGWFLTKLYELGKDKVVFNDWENLWETYNNYRNSPKNIPGFGDWSPLLDEIDPFRDGKAAQRIGTYLKWLLDGFKSGLNRETVMADAAERYCKQWGYDKISTVTPIES